MGCSNSKTLPSPIQNTDSDLQIAIERVQMTWPMVKRIDNLGPKVFAHLLHVYPVLKRVSNASPTLKSEADLIGANEHFGESLSHIVTHQIHMKLTNDEKQSWLHLMDYISAQLVYQMSLQNISED